MCSTSHCYGLDDLYGATRSEVPLREATSPLAALDGNVV